jgi:hypothetical protein
MLPTGRGPTDTTVRGILDFPPQIGAKQSPSLNLVVAPYDAALRKRYLICAKRALAVAVAVSYNFGYRYQFLGVRCPLHSRYIRRLFRLALDCCGPQKLRKWVNLQVFARNRLVVVTRRTVAIDN